MTRLYSLSDAVLALVQRNLPISISSLSRFIKAGLVPPPQRVGGRPIFDEAGLEELARLVAARQEDLKRNGWGTHRRDRVTTAAV